MEDHPKEIESILSACRPENRSNMNFSSEICTAQEENPTGWRRPALVYISHNLPIIVMTILGISKTH